MNQDTMDAGKSDFDSSCEAFSVCFNHESCWDAENRDGIAAGSWKSMFIFLSFGVLFMALAELVPRNDRLFHFISRLHKLLHNGCNHKAGAEEKLSTTSDNHKAFVTTERTEENFVRDNGDPEMVLPCPFASEYEPRFAESVVLPVTGFLGRQMGDVFSAISSRSS
jgi:hypothetical protein